jgi:hypothetical protein
VDKLEGEELEYAVHSLVDLKNLLAKVEGWMETTSGINEFWNNLVVARLHILDTIKSMEKITGAK